MTNKGTLLIGLLGFVLAVVGVSLWVLGDAITPIVPLSMASTRVLWAPLIWLLGIIVMLSAALAGTLRFKNYLMWIATLILGYLAVFAVLVAVTSLILP
jgi:hypothetical protein